MYDLDFSIGKRFGLLLASDAIMHARCLMHRPHERCQRLILLINYTNIFDYSFTNERIH